MTNVTINLSEYQSFSSIPEMNHHVAQHNRDLDKKHYQALNLLAQYSCKSIGVSYLKTETIAKRLKKSDRTIFRYIAYLKKNHFITIVNTTRTKKGGDGANIYVINSVDERKKKLAEDENVRAKMSGRKTSNKDSKTLSQQAMAYVKIKKETIFFKAIKNSFTVTGARKHKTLISRINKIMDFRACPDNVPQNIYMSNSAFFTDKQISSIYSMIVSQTEDCNLTHEEINDIAEYTFKGLVMAMRRHYKDGAEPIKNIFAYARKIARKKLVEIMDEKFYSNHVDLSNAMEEWIVQSAGNMAI